MENLTLPEAIRRLGDGTRAGDDYGAVQPGCSNPAARGSPNSGSAQGLGTADGGSRGYYSAQLRSSSRSPREYLAGRGLGSDASHRLGLGYAPGHGLRPFLESAGFDNRRLQGQRAVPGTGPGAIRWNDHRSRHGLGPGPLAHRAGRLIQPSSPASRRRPVPSRCWAWFSLGPAPQLGLWLRKGVFDYLTLASVGLPRLRCPGHPGYGQGGGGAAGLPSECSLAFDNDDAGLIRPAPVSQGNSWGGAPRWSTCPWASPTWANWRSTPTVKLIFQQAAGSGSAQRPLVHPPFLDLSSNGPPSPAGLFFSPTALQLIPLGHLCPSFVGAFRPAHGSAFGLAAFPAQPSTLSDKEQRHVQRERQRQPP